MRPKLEFSQLFQNWVRELPKEERDKLQLNGNEIYCQSCARSFAWKQKFQLYQHVSTSVHQNSLVDPVISDSFSVSRTTNQDDGCVAGPSSSGEAPCTSKGLSKSGESSSETVSLKWKTKSAHLHTALVKMFMSELSDGTSGSGGNRMLTDLCLISADGEMVEAHSVILSLCSPYFQKILLKLQGLGVVGKTAVILGNAKASCLRNILKFMYTGQVNIPSEEVDELLNLGRFLEISELSSLNLNLSETATPRKRKSSNSKTDKKSRARKGVVNPEPEEDFDEFHANVSEDDEEEYSEPEMKIERPDTPFEENSDNDEESENNSEEEEGDEVKTKGGGGKETSSGRAEQGKPIGLDGKTKEFILTLYKRGVSKPSWVVKAMKQEKMKVPSTIRIRSYVQSLKNNEFKKAGSEVADAKKTLEQEKEEPKVNPETGVLEGEEETSSSDDDSDGGKIPRKKYKKVLYKWTETQSMPDEVLYENWVVTKNREYGTGENHKVVMTFYCVHGGRRCPVKLKTERCQGKTTFFTNGEEHDNHRLKARGLSKEQKHFITKELEKGITAPADILKAMESNGQISVAKISQIRAFLKTDARKEVKTGRQLDQPTLKGPDRSESGEKTKQEHFNHPLPQSSQQPQQPIPWQSSAGNTVNPAFAAVGHHSTPQYVLAPHSTSESSSSSVVPPSHIHFHGASSSTGGVSSYGSYWQK